MALNSQSHRCPVLPVAAVQFVVSPDSRSSRVARAQPAVAPSPAETLLHLSATGPAQAPPDQLVTTLVAQATSSSGATAQQRVNGLIADGLKAARGP